MHRINWFKLIDLEINNNIIRLIIICIIITKRQTDSNEKYFLRWKQYG